MNERHISKLSVELSLPTKQIGSVAALLGEGATVPFIARYRKEATGSLDEVAITTIRDRLTQLGELDQRRESILKSLDERDLLSDELKGKVDAAETMATLEDIYLPYRPKRRTRATIAREKGLEPLAQMIIDPETSRTLDPLAEAAKFVDAEKEVETAEDALAGARDIIAEWINEDADVRAPLRKLFIEKGTISTKVMKGKEEEGAKFKDYFEWQEPAVKAPSHRVLAMFRGEREGFLMLQVTPEEEDALRIIRRRYAVEGSAADGQIELAAVDSYKRLLSPSLATETRLELKRRANEVAINVFAENLRELLMTSPLGQKRVLALDPGFRTGCKLVCLDAQSQLIFNDTIYPHTGGRGAAEAGEKLKAICEKHQIQAIAIGNGTASRETETFVKNAGVPSDITVVMVNESGASIYSASAVAREEFPDHDVTVRGAVSIGRRLMDPLAELVKIDPKSIGVGQYQHDVDQVALKRSLDDIVMSCVNGVGVDVNTASKELLTYVSGLGPTLAGNIVAYRNENGAFKSRTELKKVARLGPKAFEQAAGFLRIRDGKNPLDASAVHPESYKIVDKMAGDVGCNVQDLMSDADRRGGIKLQQYVTEKVGLPTLSDIVKELAKPGRDPREKFEAFSFADGVEKMEDLSAGMKLPGIVTNVTAFGAFVDIGVHQDGLVHISQLADRFIQDPNEVVKVQQKVLVTVTEVDLSRKRIGLSMRKDPDATPQRERKPRRSDRDKPKAFGNRLDISAALNKKSDSKDRRGGLSW